MADTTLPYFSADHRKAVLWCVLISLAVAILDVIVPNLNLSICYVVPLMGYVLIGKYRVSWWLALLLAVLTLAGYWLKPVNNMPYSVLNRLESYRMVNRLSVLAIILVLTIASGYADRLRQSYLRIQAGLSPVAPGESIFDTLNRFLVFIFCLILMVGILITDLLTPSRLNVPILYALPLLLSLWGYSRKLTWCLVPFVVGFVFLDYLWEVFYLHHDLPTPLLINRSLSSTMVVCIAIGAHFLTNPKPVIPPRGK